MYISVCPSVLEILIAKNLHGDLKLGQNVYLLTLDDHYADTLILLNP